MSDQKMKGITCCADCAYYNIKKHKCTRASDEGKPTDHFYADCPLPDVTDNHAGQWISTQIRLPDDEDETYLGVVVGSASDGCSDIILDHSVEFVNWDRESGFSLPEYVDEKISVLYWMHISEPPKEET